MLTYYRLPPKGPCREHALVQMKTIQIYYSSGLVLRRHVTIGGQNIFGEDEKGRTVLQRTNTSARLYFSSESVTDGSLPWHLVCDSLLSFLEIPQDKHAILNSILHAQDHSLIQDILERSGLFDDDLSTEHITEPTRKSNHIANNIPNGGGSVQLAIR
jgi:hypothetical protein